MWEWIFIGIESVGTAGSIITLIRMRRRRPDNTPVTFAWHGGRTKKIGERPYECLCTHLPTNHKRIEFEQDDKLWSKFGNCLAEECKCTGYMGPLPPYTQEPMAIGDSQRTIPEDAPKPDTIKQIATVAAQEIADKAKIHITATSQRLKEQIEESNRKQMRQWKRDHPTQSAITKEVTLAYSYNADEDDRDRPLDIDY